MAVTPNNIITPQTPFSATAIAVTADIAWSAPVNMVTLVDDAVDNTSGLRLTSIYAIQRAATAANLNCVLYKKVGSVYTLLDSVLMTNTTPLATVANAKADFGYSEENPLVLKAGVGLAVAIGATIANGVVFACRGGAF